MSSKGQGDPGEDHASRVGAESPCSDMKRAVAKKLIERYFYQLTDGCGNPECDNQNCASSGKVTNLTPNQAAAQAIQLFSQEARLCDGTQPSKVARTTLEPGPASLAKSLPVKSVNPTCSDEGIASNTMRNPALLINNSSVFPITIDKKINIINKLDPKFQALSCQIENFSNGTLLNKPKSFIEFTLNKKPSLISKDKSRTVCPIDHLLQSNHNPCVSSISKDRISDEANPLEILNRYKIHIPNYNDNSTKKYNKKRKNIKRSSRKREDMKKYLYNRNILSKRQLKSSSRCVTKLLILNLYLRYLQREKYSHHTTDVK